MLQIELGGGSLQNRFCLLALRMEPGPLTRGKHSPTERQTGPGSFYFLFGGGILLCYPVWS